MFDDTIKIILGVLNFSIKLVYMLTFGHFIPWNCVVRDKAVLTKISYKAFPSLTNWDQIWIFFLYRFVLPVAYNICIDDLHSMDLLNVTKSTS